MSATLTPTPDGPVDQPKLDDLLPLFGGGIALAGVAIIGCALIDAVLFAVLDGVFGSDVPASWPTELIVVFGVLVVLVSILVGRWMLNLRRWIGLKGDAADSEMIRRKRRSFTIGALCMYIPVTPLLWVFFVALAYSADAV